MQIYVVKSGDTLTNISRRYNVPVERLIITNKIPNPNSLVPGQTIVIPIWGSFYFVKPGDSLYSISYRYKIPLQQLIDINNIKDPSSIMPGMRIYIPQQPRSAIFTGAYIDTDITSARSKEVVEEVGDLLSTIQLFSYQVDSKGNLKPLQFENEVLEASKAVKAKPLMVLTNIEEGKFSTEVATEIFNNKELQEKVLNEVISIMKEKGYRGLDVDFEYLGKENKEGYNQFLANTKKKLAPLGYTLSTAVAPKESDVQVGILYEGHDYAFHGEIANYIFIMTYEWGWVGGPPRAVAPLNEVKKVMDYAITKIPKEKIMMGIPLYGYDWKLPYVKGESRAKTISSQEAILLADKYNVSIEYDPVAASPYFKYVDENKEVHEVWFEDARSIQAKFNLAKSLGIRGVFYWVLGREFPQNWLLLEDNFVIKKY